MLRDVANGTAKPIYNYLDNMPELSSAVPPILPPKLVRLVLTEYSSFDAGRGCPFQCSFCTIINVQGRISRYRSADDVETIVRANAAQGVTRFFVTDDNFARNRNWEASGTMPATSQLDRLISMTAISVLSGSRGVRHRLRSFNFCMGVLHRFTSAPMDAISSPPPHSISVGGDSHPLEWQLASLHGHSRPMRLVPVSIYVGMAGKRTFLEHA